MHLLRDPLPRPRGRPPLNALRVIGVGNRWRSDDGAGLEVAARLRGSLPAGVEVLEREGEPTALIGAWADADAVWLADAVRSGAAAGTLHRLDATAGEKHEEPGMTWTVLSDPAGNEFCVGSPHD